MASKWGPRRCVRCGLMKRQWSWVNKLDAVCKECYPAYREETEVEQRTGDETI